MEISAANLTSLFTGFDVVFQRGFEKPPSYYEQITSVVRSASRQTTYPWLGRTTKFREWLGDRVIQALETHEYTIVNRNFEDTVAIDRNDIEDDTYGAYEPIIEQLGWDTKVHPDMLLFAMIKNAVATPSEVVGFDGQPFFSASHPVGLMGQAGTPTSNINSSGSGAYWYLIDASRVIRPFIFQLRREYAVTRMTNVADEAVFNRREFRYGVDGRANTGVGPVAVGLCQQHRSQQSGQLRRGARRDACVQNRCGTAVWRAVEPQRRVPAGAADARRSRASTAQLRIHGGRRRERERRHLEHLAQQRGPDSQRVPGIRASNDENSFPEPDCRGSPSCPRAPECEATLRGRRPIA